MVATSNESQVISGSRAAREAAGKRIEEARQGLWLAMNHGKEVAAQASEAGVPDAAIARDLGVSRMTVRKWLGK